MCSSLVCPQTPSSSFRDMNKAKPKGLGMGKGKNGHSCSSMLEKKGFQRKSSSVNSLFFSDPIGFQ